MRTVARIGSAAVRTSAPRVGAGGGRRGGGADSAVYSAHLARPRRRRVAGLSGRRARSPRVGPESRVARRVVRVARAGQACGRSRRLGGQGRGQRTGGPCKANKTDIPSLPPLSSGAGQGRARRSVAISRLPTSPHRGSCALSAFGADGADTVRTAGVRTLLGELEGSSLRFTPNRDKVRTLRTPLGVRISRGRFRVRYVSFRPSQRLT